MASVLTGDVMLPAEISGHRSLPACLLIEKLLSLAPNQAVQKAPLRVMLIPPRADPDPGSILRPIEMVALV
jgi:hypothetical protein